MIRKYNCGWCSGEHIYGNYSVEVEIMDTDLHIFLRFCSNDCFHVWEDFSRTAEGMYSAGEEVYFGDYDEGP